MRMQLGGRSGEAGSALIVSLTMLSLISMFAAYTATSSITENRMVGNQRRYASSFYSGEQGLSSGEKVIDQLPNRVALNEGAIVGHYDRGQQPPWQELRWDDTDSESVQALDPNSGTLRYTIEVREARRDSWASGTTPPGAEYYLFTVTTRSSNPSSGTEIFLRSVYAKRFD